MFFITVKIPWRAHAFFVSYCIQEWYLVNMGTTLITCCALSSCQMKFPGIKFLDLEFRVLGFRLKHRIRKCGDKNWNSCMSSNEGAHLYIQRSISCLSLLTTILYGVRSLALSIFCEGKGYIISWFPYLVRTLCILSSLKWVDNSICKVRTIIVIIIANNVYDDSNHAQIFGPYSIRSIMPTSTYYHLTPPSNDFIMKYCIIQYFNDEKYCN